MYIVEIAIIVQVCTVCTQLLEQRCTAVCTIISTNMYLKVYSIKYKYVLSTYVQ